MKTIGLFFGGRSVEHDVSVVSAQVINRGFLKLTSEFKLIPIYLTARGDWVVLNKFPTLKELTAKKNASSNVTVILRPKQERLTLKWKGWKGLFSRPLIIDVALPLMHGSNGEDGTLQGFFETVNVPYAGPGILGSAVGMDKVITKDICRANHLPVVDYFWFYREEWEQDKAKIKAKIKDRLSWPIFIKPANLGSSIGISKAVDDRSLEDAIEIAIRYSRKLVAEQGIESVQEINCAVVGFKDRQASLLEEPVSYSKFLTFEDKYIGGGKKGGGTMSGAKHKVKIPAPVEPAVQEKITSLALKLFGLLECCGAARVDFLVSPDGQVFINEINTIPGSLQQHLWQASGVSLPELLKKTIALAEEVFIEKKKNLTRFESTLLR